MKGERREKNKRCEGEDESGNLADCEK